MNLFIDSSLSSLSTLLAKASRESSFSSTMSPRLRRLIASSYSSRMFCSSVVDVASVCVPIYIPSPSTNTSHLNPVFSKDTFASKSHSCWNLSFLFDNLCFSSARRPEHFFHGSSGSGAIFLLIFCNMVVDYTLDIVRTDGRFFGKSTPHKSGLRRSCLQTALRWRFVFFVFVVVAVV